MILRRLLIVLVSILVWACSSEPQVQETEESVVAAPIDSVRALVAQDSSNAQAFARLAILELQGRDLKAAQLAANTAIRLDSNDLYVLESFGDVFFVLNQTRKSRDSWTRCAELDEENVACRLKLAELYFAVRSYSEALERLNEVLLIEGRNPNALFLKGNVYKEMGDTANAATFIQAAIDANPEFYDAYEQLGVLYAAQGDSLAVVYYQKAIELQPNEPNIYYNLGVYHQAQEQWNRALEAYSSAVQVDPKHFNSHYNMGYIHVLLSVWNQGAVHFTDAINAKSDYYQAFYGRAYCFEMLGDVKRAKEDYERAVNMKVDYQPAREGLDRVERTMSVGQ